MDRRARAGNKKTKTTFIGVLATHEDPRRHRELVDLLNSLTTNKGLLRNFSFVFTGGTFDRVLRGSDGKFGEPVAPETLQFLKDSGLIRLPPHDDGGVVIIADLVVRRKIGIVWSFLTPVSSHWLQPENIALTRLCDYWHVNRLLNSHSVMDWLAKQSSGDSNRFLQAWPPLPDFMCLDSIVPTDDGRFQLKPIPGFANSFEVDFGDESEREAKRIIRRATNQLRLALIAHDAMKERMVEFVIDYEHELSANCSQIITTGTTGTRVKEAARTLAEKVVPYHSGPKGGDIQIATAILLGLIDIVIFFIDPLNPHPHIDDIRVVFGACMTMPVRMLTNERQARQWMEAVMVPAAREKELGGRALPATAQPPGGNKRNSRSHRSVRRTGDRGRFGV
jgi:methylglyoxal synthase